MKLTQEQEAVLSGEHGDLLDRNRKAAVRVELRVKMNSIRDGEWLEVDSDQGTVRIFENQRT